MGTAALVDDMTFVALKMKALPTQSLPAQPVFPAQQVVPNANGQSHGKILAGVEVY
jgi:hypothetical protein